MLPSLLHWQNRDQRNWKTRELQLHGATRQTLTNRTRLPFLPRLSARPLPCFSLVTICLIFIVLFAGCDTAASTRSKEPVPTTRAATTPASLDLVNVGVLTVGSYVNYAPQEYKDTVTGKTTGFDIDLIQAIGLRMKLKVQIADVDFSSLLNRLMEKQLDIAISAIPITTDMQAKVTFIPYFKSGEAMLVEKGNPHQITNSANLCGLNVGVQTDTIEQDDLKIASDTCRRAGKALINIIAASSQQSVIQLLLARRVSAVYQDAPAADYAIKLYPDRFEFGGSITNVTTEGIAIRKDNRAMLNAVQEAFNSLVRNNTYHALIVKWGLLHGEIPGDTRKKR